jgi:hypothetical protein
MPITQTEVDEVFADSKLATSTPRVVDITADVVELDLHTKARQAYTVNRAFLANAAPTNAQVLAQVRALTRQTQALIRLVVARDLLVDEVVD